MSKIFELSHETVSLRGLYLCRSQRLEERAGRLPSATNKKNACKTKIFINCVIRMHWSSIRFFRANSLMRRQSPKGHKKTGGTKMTLNAPGEGQTFQILELLYKTVEFCRSGLILIFLLYQKVYLFLGGYFLSGKISTKGKKSHIGRREKYWLFYCRASVSNIVRVGC